LQRTYSDISWIAEAELLPDFLPAIRERLAREPTLIDTSPMAKHLLLKAIEHEREVDLSLFQSLSEEDLSVFISRLSKTVSLSLSGASISTGPLALNLSPANTSLGKLYFLDSPKLQLQQVLRLMDDP
jgi:hypothetical protein